MKLSDIKGGHRLERDGEFLSIAEMPRWRSGTLVPIIDAAQIERLTAVNFTGCVIITKTLVPKVPKGVGVIVSDRPFEELCEIHNSLVKEGSFYKPPADNAIDSSAEIHQTAVISGKGVRIGKRCIIAPKAMILEGSTLEDDVVIGPGTVIGGEDPLSFRKGSALEKARSSGGVIIRKDVEIHANCKVSRAVFGGSTEVGAGAKFDNLISIGQNAKVGERSFLAACATICSNVDMGEEAWIGPNSTVSSGVTLGGKAYVTIGAVVVGDVGQGKKVTGNPAIDHDIFIERLKKMR
jgi:acetyltransferase-like isoleucine patch superfamily enzyme